MGWTLMGLQIVRLVLCVGLLLGLSACGLSSVQRDAATQFSRAAAAFGESVSTQMAEIRSTAVDLHMHAVALNPSKIKERDKIDGAFDPQRVGVRIQAAKVLQNYGELLLALIEETQEKELESAAGRFTQSLRGLDPGQIKISEGQLEAIGKIVTTIGGLFVEHKKKEVLATIVPKAHDQITAIGALFGDEFDPKNGPIAKNFDAMSLRTVSYSDAILDSQGSSLTDRSIAAYAHRKGIESSRKANTIFPSMAGAATGVTKAHEQLVKALDEKAYSTEDLVTFTKKVEDLLAATKLFSNK